MDDIEDSVSDRGVLTASDETWERAVRAAGIVGPLANLSRVGRDRVDGAAAELGVSRRQLYVLLQRWREGDGLVSDLIPSRSSGGRGRTHLPDAVEVIIAETIGKGFLTRQRRTVAAVHRDIARACRGQGLPSPVSCSEKWPHLQLALTHVDVPQALLDGSAKIHRPSRSRVSGMRLFSARGDLTIGCTSLPSGRSSRPSLGLVEAI